MMNEQSYSTNFSGNSQNNPLSATLISMQIQALRESLRRLVDVDDLTEVELLGNELKEIGSEPNC